MLYGVTKIMRICSCIPSRPRRTAEMQTASSWMGGAYSYVLYIWSHVVPLYFVSFVFSSSSPHGPYVAQHCHVIWAQLFYLNVILQSSLFIKIAYMLLFVLRRFESLLFTQLEKSSTHLLLQNTNLQCLQPISS